MFELKRLSGHFVWDAGSSSGRWARALREQNHPLIWLTCISTPSGRDLYCVNQSDKVIESLEIIRNCHACVDGEYFHKEVPELCYLHIQPNEAVKVEHYDEDLLLGLQVRVKSKNLGQHTLASKNVLGGVKKDEVLLWKNKL